MISTQTSESFDHFVREGYQVFRGVVPAEVQRELFRFLSAEAESAVQELLARFDCGSQAELIKLLDQWTESGRIADVDPQTRTVLTGHYPLSVRLSAALRAVPQAPSVRALISEVLGTDRLFLHVPPTARFVLPGNPHAGVPAHQDVSYNKHMSNFVTMWTPLVPIDDECGGVIVYRGSNQPLESLKTHDRVLWLAGVSTEGFTPVHCLMGPGDVLLLNKWVIHASMRNVSSRTRISIDYRLFSQADASTKHYLDLQTGQVHAPAA